MINKTIAFDCQDYQYHVCDHVDEIFEIVKGVFCKYENLLPVSKQAKILIKLNLNSNMNSLTGNTTDLRIVAAVLSELKNRGYGNIVIGEGTSSGFYRNKINVAQRLKVLDLIKKFESVTFLDFNYDDKEIIDFEDGVKAGVAKTCLDADFFINLPKVKMHFETTMSCCLKSFIGCLVGLNEKQKVHYSLFKNIIHLNEKIKPHLIIADGLISMEGTGPSLGTPLKTNFILAGRNPFLLDLLCAKISGVDYKKIPVLMEAKKKNYLTEGDIEKASSFKPAKIYSFKRPTPSIWSKIINNQAWQKYFIKLRIGPLDWFFNIDFVGDILNFFGLRQDVFNTKETDIKKITVGSKCNQCLACEKYCPARLKLSDIGNIDKGCFNCLYCYSVCPRQAISVDGELGFFQEQEKKYQELIRKMGEESIEADKNIKVSIIIPTYNSSETLKKVIESCLAQTWKNIEIIVVDNNSKDNTKEIAQGLGAKVYNAGPERGAQRNFGAREASGNYLIFLDSDITISETVVEESLKLAIAQSAEVITFKEYIVGTGFFAECRKIEAQCYFNDDMVEAPRFYSKGAFWSVNGFDEDLNLTGTEDWDLRERILVKGYKIFRISSPTFHHEGQVKLKERILNKKYYAQSFITYNKKHQGHAKIPFLRECYLRNWRLLIKHPVLTGGFFFMKFSEGLAALYTMKKLSGNKRISNKDVYKY